MTLSRTELKGQSRQKLLGKYGITAGALFLYYLIVNVLRLLVRNITAVNAYSLRRQVSVFSIVTYFICTLIIILLSHILLYGYYYLHLNIARDRQYGIRDLFYGFAYQPDKVILLTLRIILINLLYILPLTIAYLGLDALVSPSSQVWQILFVSATVLVYLAVLLPVNLRYVLTFYLWADDPELSSSQIMQKSRSMMQGNRVRYFGLMLSFIGLFLLAFLSLGIGLLWVQPYRIMTCTQFYLERKKHAESELQRSR